MLLALAVSIVCSVVGAISSVRRILKTLHDRGGNSVARTTYYLFITYKLIQKKYAYLFYTKLRAFGLITVGLAGTTVLGCYASGGGP